MILYLIGATLTAGLLLNAFLKDESTSNSDLYSWLVVLVGSLLWFACLPLILRKLILRKPFAAVLGWLAPVTRSQGA